jgi:hypothetical protein
MAVVCVMMVVVVGMSHLKMLYYNITRVQKRKEARQAPSPLPIQSFDFSENGGEQWR